MGQKIGASASWSQKDVLIRALSLDFGSHPENVQTRLFHKIALASNEKKDLRCSAFRQGLLSYGKETESNYYVGNHTYFHNLWGSEICLSFAANDFFHSSKISNVE